MNEEHMNNRKPKHLCASCAAAEVCKHTFGDWYASKSRNGSGCDYPITVTPDHIRAMNMATVAAMRMREEAEDADKAPRQQPLWHKYIVTHRLKDYPTTAHSPEQAVNFVRFKLYGARPADTLPPFAVREADATPTRTDARTGANAHLSLDAIRARLGRLART